MQLLTTVFCQIWSQAPWLNRLPGIFRTYIESLQFPICLTMNCNRNGQITTAAPLQGRIALILNYYFFSEKDFIFASWNLLFIISSLQKEEFMQYLELAALCIDIIIDHYLWWPCWALKPFDIFHTSVSPGKQQGNLQQQLPCSRFSVNQLG